MKNRLSLPNVSGKYGAPMGRRNELPNDHDAPIKLQMEKLRFVDGDYDTGGSYWGGGKESMFCAFGEDEEKQVRIFVRATNRNNAKMLVRDLVPNARFYR